MSLTATTIESQPQTETSPKEDNNLDCCIVCWEEPSNDKPTLILSCNHGACRVCIQSWIERCEHDGQAEPSCPNCRQTIVAETIQEVMGRPYKAPLVVNENISNDDNDADLHADYTQNWLQTNAHQCSNCGMYMVRDGEPEDYDDENQANACVCGFLFCWSCNEGAVHCGCEHYEFYDQLTGEMLSMEDANRYPVAGPEQFEDLTDFMEERRQAIYRYLEGEDDVVEEPAEAYLIALFEEYTEDAEAAFLSILEWIVNDTLAVP